VICYRHTCSKQQHDVSSMKYTSAVMLHLSFWT